MDGRHRFLYSVVRRAFRVEGIYRLCAATAGRFSGGVERQADASGVLEEASPRPAGGLDVPPRAWPAVPEVDVSVIVPCYNVERFAAGCLESITSQETSRSLEVIAVDDGSTDGTGAILDSAAASDRRVRVIHQANRGFSGARNRGIAECRGGELVFVDSDDLLMPGALEALCDAYEEGGCDYVTASYQDMSEDGSTVTPLSGRRHHGAPWGRLYSREVWRDLEFPEGFWFEDTVQGFCVEPRWRERYVDVPVYLYRDNSLGITRTAGRNKKGLDTLWIVDEMLEWDRQLGIPFDQGMYDRVLWQLGPILWGRTTALDERERRAAFLYACEIVRKCDPSRLFSSARHGRWIDLERGLRERDYSLWRIAVLGRMG